jgi:hypothetical protein
MKSASLSWKFPKKDFLILRIEIVLVGFLALLVYLVSYLESNGSWFLATMFTALFLSLYFLVSYAIQRWRQVEEHYRLTSKHLEVVRKKRNVTKKEKAPLKEIAHHKLDKTFLGGYLLTRRGKKHLLFFNSKQEVEKFESFLKRHLHQ